jgi:hypothetical protein
MNKINIREANHYKKNMRTGEQQSLDQEKNKS